MELTIDNETLQSIQKILTRGNTVELKKVKGELVVVEIERKVRVKQVIKTE